MVEWLYGLSKSAVSQTVKGGKTRVLMEGTDGEHGAFTPRPVDRDRVLAG
jgi:hypothetical protein